jgi:hypothetical protein
MSRPNRYASKEVTRQHQRVMLGACLIQRENLETVDVGSLARSYGTTPDDVRKAVEHERQRRTVAGRVG